MEFLLPAVFFIVVVTGGVVFVSTFQRNQKQRALLAKTPASLLPGGAPSSSLVENARTNYALAQRAVRILEHLLEKQDTMPFLSPDEAKRIKLLVEDFYGEES